MLYRSTTSGLHLTPNKLNSDLVQTLGEIIPKICGYNSDFTFLDEQISFQSAS